MTHDQKGFVLVPVIWMLVLLSAICAAALNFVRDSSSLSKVTINRLELDDIAHSAIVYGLRQINYENELKAGHANFVIDGSIVHVSWRNEASRVDINLASAQLLRSLFLASGADNIDADDYVSRIMRERDKGGRNQDSLNMPFNHASDIVGLNLPKKITQNVFSMATIYSGSSKIDPRLVDDILITNLPGMSEMLKREIKEASDNSLSEIKDRENGTFGPIIDSTPSRALRFRIVTNLHGSQWLGSEIVLIRFFDDPEPYRILSWQNITQADENSAVGIMQ